METELLDTKPMDTPDLGPASHGLRPIPDPTRSGALWVGGAGVTLLLAAAAVLTAVRWDDIGQSVKLGGLVAITVLLLTAGQRFKQSIPMTAQAIFHLGALLIPFDMAAVAILAGRSWQETLLLTSLTSVLAWSGIERAVPSQVLAWASRGAMVMFAAGVAAMSPISMSLALAGAAVVAIAARQTTSALVWGSTAGLLPIGAFVLWPTRLAGAMADLGFDAQDRWQPLAAGALATLTVIATTRLLPRIEIAWLAVLLGAVTVAVALGGFADAQISLLSLAVIFIGLELLTITTARDTFWKPIVDVVALAGEVIAAYATAMLLAGGLVAIAADVAVDGLGYGISVAVLGLGWLIADQRRLAEDVDWLTGMLFGSDWLPTTLMFPTAVLAAEVLFGAPSFVVALTAVALAYWMVVTWRTESRYVAIVLVAVAVAAATPSAHWGEFLIAVLGGSVLALAAQLRARAGDSVGSMIAAMAAVLAWLIGTSASVRELEAGWPIVLVLAGAWVMSWIVEARGPRRAPEAADWVGRLTASTVLALAFWAEPFVGIALCAAAAALAIIDNLLLRRASVDEGHPLRTGYAAFAGVALGIAGVPITSALGLIAPTAGAVLAIASFVIIGIALASPRVIELPLGMAAGVAAGCGLLMAFGDAGMFAVALLAVGSSVVFVAAALRDVVIGVAGYITIALGVSLQLAVWGVDWLEPYLVLPALAALYVGHRFHRRGGSSWAAYAPTVGLMAYVAIADRFTGGSAWHTVIAGAIGVVAIIAGGHRKLVGPLVTGSMVLAVVVGYESLGPAALVPTWAWLATGGTVLLSAGVLMERTDTSPLERGQHVRNVLATQFS